MSVHQKPVDRDSSSPLRRFRANSFPDLFQRGPRLLSLAVALAVAAFLLWGDVAQAQEPFRVRVLSYNIHHGEGTDRKLDLERIARVIRSVSPDIVALQEVDRRTPRSGGIDQPAELARLTGMQVVFEQNIPYLGGEYGNAVLTRFAIQDSKNHHLPRFDEGEQRGVLELHLQPEDCPSPLLFLCTHLDHRRDDRERLASAKAIAELVEDSPKLPAILAGDLNARPESAVLEAFKKHWQLANSDKVLPTLPVDEPKFQIDYIVFRPAERWKTVEIRVLDEAVASDHRPIFAVLELHTAD